MGGPCVWVALGELGIGQDAGTVSVHDVLQFVHPHAPQGACNAEENVVKGKSFTEHPVGLGECLPEVRREGVVGRGIGIDVDFEVVVC